MHRWAWAASWQSCCSSAWSKSILASHHWGWWSQDFVTGWEFQGGGSNFRLSQIFNTFFYILTLGYWSRRILVTWRFILPFSKWGFQKFPHLALLFPPQSLPPPRNLRKESEQKESEVGQSCLTLCDTVNCNLPDSSVHGIPQARILAWVAISFSRGSSWLRRTSQTANPTLSQDILLQDFYSSFQLLYFLNLVQNQGGKKTKQNNIYWAPVNTIKKKLISSCD